MSAERTQRVRELFDQALERDSSERNSFLEQQCASDQALRDEVESLLAAFDQAPSFLEPPAAQHAAREAAPASLTEAGPVGHDGPDSIGGYRILRLLGEGGMGVVYEARQEHPRRAVALKVIRGPGTFGQIDEHTLRLFQREVQTLARLEHPGIAAIYEAGCTESGQHFFAMELVRGVPLNQYVQANKPSISARLRLFRKICEAINYAHQRGVIHRDLKPSNILIDEEENPKVLDFGLAKMTDSDVTVATVVTEVGKVQGTLPYMSPEQARGDPGEINLLTDVYALGVILYELLTGQLPYDVRRTILPEALRVICEDAPRRPSTVDRMLRGDIETIALKALEKDPARRYQSAAALAEDVERYLTNQPILARAPTTIYQLRKLIARHKTPSAFIALLFVLVTGAAIWMSVLYRQADRLRLEAETARDAEQVQRQLAEASLARTEEAERVARTAARKAERINQFLLDMLAAADPERAPGRDMTIREVLDETVHTIDTAFVDEPEVEMGVRTVVATTYHSLGHYKKAEEHFRACLAIGETLAHTATPDLQLQRARGMLKLGSVVMHQDRFAEAEELFAEAARLLSDSVGDEHPATSLSHDRMGVLLWKQGRYGEAEPLLRTACENLKQVLGESHRDAVLVCNNLALILSDQGRHVEAEPIFRKLLHTAVDGLGEAHPQTARAYNNLAWNLQRSGKYAEAESLHRKAIAVWQSSQTEDHPEAALSRNNLGLALNLQGKFAEAEAVYREALEMNRRMLGAEHTQTAGSYLGLGWALHELGRHDEAEGLVDTALTIYRQEVGDEHYSVARCYELKGRGLNLQGKFAEAELPIQKALDINVNHLGENHPDTVRLYNELAFVFSKQGKYARAEQLFRKALDAHIRTLGEKHPATLIPMHNVAAILERQDKAGEAEPFYRKVVQLAHELMPEGSPTTDTFHGTLGNCLITLGQYEEAEQNLLTAYVGLKASLGEDSDRAKGVVEDLIRLYEAWGKPDEASKYNAPSAAFHKKRDYGRWTENPFSVLPEVPRRDSRHST